MYDYFLTELWDEAQTSRRSVYLSFLFVTRSSSSTFKLDGGISTLNCLEVKQTAYKFMPIGAKLELGQARLGCGTRRRNGRNLWRECGSLLRVQCCCLCKALRKGVYLDTYGFAVDLREGERFTGLFVHNDK